MTLTKSQEELFIKFKEWFNNKNKKQMFVITGRAGCVDMDTEFFTGNKWKKISEYTEGDKVLQYNLDGSAELVKPIQYHKYPCEELTLIKSKYGLEQCVSDEHNMIYMSSKGNLNKKSFIELKNMHYNSINGFGGRFYTTFTPKLDSKINLSDNEIRLMVAVIADGSFMSKNSNLCRLNLKKQRKKERIEKILKDCNLEYKKRQWNPKYLDYDNYTFNAPIREKIFTKEWYSCSLEQLAIICDEIQHWDSSVDVTVNNIKRVRFSTTTKETADFIQYAFSSIGMRATIFKQDRVGQVHKNSNEKLYIRKSVEYSVVVTKRNMVGISNRHTKECLMTKYKTIDGFKYCFSVPSGMLVLRRNGKINITGNSGKTSMLKLLTEYIDEKTYSYAVVSFTGKAVDVLNKKGINNTSTLHSLIYKPIIDESENIVGWQKRDNIEQDIIFVDEASMLSKTMIEDLLDYRKPIVFVLDSKQLPPVGEDDNWLNDKIDFELTEIVRQANGSPIINYANIIRNGTMVSEKINVKNEKGKFTTFKESMITEEMLFENITKYDMIVVGTNKKRIELNNIYRKAKGYNDVLCEGENIIILKNNKDGFYNGQILTVNKIIEKHEEYFKIETYEGEVYVSLEIIKNRNADMKDLFKKKYFIEEELKDILFIDYGNVLTAHKSQGSTCNKVLVFGKNMMFLYYQNPDKKIGWENYMRGIYTAITRAKEECVLLL